MSSRTCDACGARNAEAADWCTQCFASLAPTGGVDPREQPRTGADDDDRAPRAPGRADDVGRETQVPARGDHGASSSPDAGASAATTDAATGAAATGDVPGDVRPHRAASHRDIRQTAEGEVEWRCATCEGWNPLEVATCTACGAPRRGFGPEPDASAPPLDEDRLVALSILLPGLGHVQAGRAGSGVARALFGLGWLVGGLLLLLAAARAGAAYLAALPLLAGAAVVWVLTVLDVRSLARGETTERLDGRTLLWLMAGVTGALVLVLMVDTWRLAG